MSFIKLYALWLNSGGRSIPPFRYDTRKCPINELLDLFSFPTTCAFVDYSRVCVCVAIERTNSIFDLIVINVCPPLILLNPETLHLSNSCSWFISVRLIDWLTDWLAGIPRHTLLSCCTSTSYNPSSYLVVRMLLCYCCCCCCCSVNNNYQLPPSSTTPTSLYLSLSLHSNGRILMMLRCHNN